MEVSGRYHALAALPTLHKADIHRTGRLTGPQNWYERFGEKKRLLPRMGLEIRTVQTADNFKTSNLRNRIFLRSVIPVVFAMII